MGYYQTARFPKPAIRAVDQCEHCGGPMPVPKYPSTVRRFCGVICRNRWIVEKRRRFAARECPICRRRMKGPGLTCSTACGYKFRKLRYRTEKTCPVCRTRFWPLKQGHTGLWAKYCSKACYNVKRGARLAMLHVTCAHCARTFRRTAGAVKRVTRIFCNQACASKFLSGENHANWRGGHDPNRGPAWLRRAREIRKRDGYKCQRCQLSQAENGRQLDVDHIIPWRTFSTADEANDPSNLVSLCMRCHRHKTMDAERKYLKGDVLGMQQYQKAIKPTPPE